MILRAGIRGIIKTATAPARTVKGITVSHYNKLRVEFHGTIFTRWHPYGGIRGGGWVSVRTLWIESHINKMWISLDTFANLVLKTAFRSKHPYLH